MIFYIVVEKHVIPWRGAGDLINQENKAERFINATKALK